ncbi:hypothetical protein RclHR1_03380011 [Rhizophagus clarus]|uniref:BTB/POZ domain-containing protein n=1 Tax=Rhizophagus clarus TaxID=94130 RepID=A0A2Z6RPA9_9GLOM|nr:hypothetical protein RclHR1_03380011 [Rhizophagus clarus]GES94786.1 BTB/POZ domain-containing protein [Rhizophagus clarus]
MLDSSTKIVDAGAFCDLELTVGESPHTTVFRLHSTILKNRSTYFKNVLSSDKVEKVDNIFKIRKENVSVEIFHIIFKYIYNDVIDFASDIKTNIDLLIAADDLCLTEMCSEIEAKLLSDKELLKKNFVTITHAVNKFDHFTNLLQFYKNTLQEDPTLIFKANDFTTINRDIFLDLVSIYPFKPIEVWDKLLEWAFTQINKSPSEIANCTSDDISTLKDLMQPFVSHIKFKDIHSHEFSQKVKPYKEILNSDLYIEILEYYSFDDDKISKCRTDIDSQIINSEQAFLLANLIKILENPSVYASVSKRLDVFFYKFTLLVRGSRDGYSTSTFHNLCDGKGPTLTIARVRRTNEIIGGFNPYSWYSEGGDCTDDSYRRDSPPDRRSFIFSLDKKNLENSVFSKVKSGECAHFNGDDVGPNFGGRNADLVLLCYNDNQGKCVKKNYETRIRDSTDYFDIDEYEVFHVNGYNCNNLLYFNQSKLLS